MLLPSSIRYVVFLLFAASAVVALAAWAVRTRRVDPFSRTGRLLRNLTEPLILPVERWLVRRGGNPQNAAWWIFGIALVGGIVLITVATWMASQIALASRVPATGRGVVKLVVFYAGQLILFALIIRVIASWLGAFRYSRWMRPVYLLTDWVIEPLRKIIPPIGGMIDITPLIAWFAIRLLLNWLMRML